jgi:hypothetical protein
MRKSKRGDFEIEELDDVELPRLEVLLVYFVHLTGGRLDDI